MKKLIPSFFLAFLGHLTLILFSSYIWADDYLFASYIDEVDSDLVADYIQQLNKEGHNAEWVSFSHDYSPKDIILSYFDKDGIVFVGTNSDEQCLSGSTADNLPHGPWISFITTTSKETTELYLSNALAYRKLTQTKAYGKVISFSSSSTQSLDFKKSGEVDFHSPILLFTPEPFIKTNAPSRDFKNFGEWYSRSISKHLKDKRERLLSKMKREYFLGGSEDDDELLALSAMFFTSASIAMTGTVTAACSKSWNVFFISMAASAGSLIPVGYLTNPTLDWFADLWFDYHKDYWYSEAFSGTSNCLPPLFGDGTIPVNRHSYPHIPTSKPHPPLRRWPLPALSGEASY